MTVSTRVSGAPAATSCSSAASESITVSEPVSALSSLAMTVAGYQVLVRRMISAASCAVDSCTVRRPRCTTR
ncbi:hypothetical protein MAHJHV29_38320 [Mycobacterium avium subsp. hominissuis]